MTDEQKQMFLHDILDRVGMAGIGQVVLEQNNTFHIGADVERKKPTGAVEQVLNDLQEEKQDDGSPLLTDRYQWYAVFRVLSDMENYPRKMSDFNRRMQTQGMDAVRVPCVYNSLKQGSQFCPKYVADLSHWHQFKDISDQYRKVYQVAEFLMKFLGYWEG